MLPLKRYEFQASLFKREEVVAILALFFIGIMVVSHAPRPVVPPVFFQMFPRYHGTASWYSESDPYVQELTANGEVFDDKAATCASWDFPFGTYIKVTNVQSGEYVICRVNDRGPKGSLNRVIDLTKSSFQKIADPDLGLVQVALTPLPRLEVQSETQGLELSKRSLMP